MKNLKVKLWPHQKRWVLIDASGATLGRLAVLVSMLLRGKQRPDYSPHSDRGDNVIIVNAKLVRLTGTKMKKKFFYWHTGWIGGIRRKTAGQILEGKNPGNLIQKAVERMIPRTVLGREVMKNLKVYDGKEHPHAAQKPEILLKNGYAYREPRGLERSYPKTQLQEKN